MAETNHTVLDGKKAREALKQLNPGLRIAQAGVISETMAYCVIPRLGTQMDRVAELIGSSAMEECGGTPQ